MIVHWSQTAIEDLRSIYDYIAQDKPGAAGATIEKLFQSGDALALHPNIGRAGRRKGTRELIHLPFFIVYSIDGDIVDIHAVLHGSRKYD